MKKIQEREDSWHQQILKCIVPRSSRQVNAEFQSVRVVLYAWKKVHVMGKLYGLDKSPLLVADVDVCAWMGCRQVYGMLFCCRQLIAAIVCVLAMLNI